MGVHGGLTIFFEIQALYCLPLEKEIPNFFNLCILLVYSLGGHGLEQLKTNNDKKSKVV